MQINLHRSVTVRNLMFATAQERGIDIVIVPEHPRSSTDNERQVTNPDDDCEIVLTRAAVLTVDQRGSGPVYSWMSTGNTKIYSCYLAPRQSLQNFHYWFEGIAHSIRLTSRHMGIVLAGDFNAKSFEWGSGQEEIHGRPLAETKPKDSASFRLTWKTRRRSNVPKLNRWSTWCLPGSVTHRSSWFWTISSIVITGISPSASQRPPASTQTEETSRLHGKVRAWAWRIASWT